MKNVLWDALAVVGILTVLATAGLALIAYRWYLAERRVRRARRDARARTHTPDTVTTDDRLWVEFATDHDLNKIPTPEEWK